MSTQLCQDLIRARIVRELLDGQVIQKNWGLNIDSAADLEFWSGIRQESVVAGIWC